MVAVSSEPADVHFALRPVRKSVRIIRAVGRWVHRIAGRLPGEYTIGKLDAFDRFRERATLSWELSILILSPLPCFIANMLLESIPLADPALGFKGSLHFQIRHYLTTVIVCMMPVLAKADFIPQLTTHSWTFVFVYSSIHGAVAIGSNAIISEVADVFPVPFAQIAPTVPLAIVGALLNRQFLEKPSIKKRAEKIDQWAAMDVVPIFVYPVFTAGFMALKPKEQFWLSLLLPIIKRLLRQIIWLVLKDDLDIVGATTCTVGHLYHVLFTAMCLQNAKSLDTLGAIVVVNIFLALLNCRGIIKDADKIQRTKEQLRGSSVFMTGEVVSVALRLAQLDHVSSSLHRKSPSRMFSKYPGYQRVNLMARYHKLLTANDVALYDLPTNPTGQDTRPACKNFHQENKHRSLLSSKSPSKQMTTPIQDFSQIHPQTEETFACMASIARERTAAHGDEARAQTDPSIRPRGDHTREIEAYIQNVTSTLHQTEMILLRSYITIIVLLFYGMYLVLVFWLPNKKYYATMSSTKSLSDVDSTVFYLILLGSVQVTFMVMYLILISRRLEVSGIHQLAFVLWSQRVLIQAKFLTLSLMILGFPLEHYGTSIIFKLQNE